MSRQLLPGEVLLVPKFIDADFAIKLGSSLCTLSETTKSKVDMAAFVYKLGVSVRGEMSLDDQLREELNEVDRAAQDALAGPSPEEIYLMTTYMNSDIRRFAWHIDPLFDVRPIINIGNQKTSILLSRTTSDLDLGGVFLKTPPEDEDQIEIALEPGDAYFIDNRTSEDRRMPHCTPLNSAGRLMLRYSFVYPTSETDPFDFSQFEDTTSISLFETAA